MSRLSDFAGALGFGRDEAGDAARREALSADVVRPDELRELVDRGALSSPTLRRALTAEAGRITEEARRMSPSAGPDDPDPVPGHALTRTRTAAGNIIAVCECGRWDGGWTGPRSRRRVLDDHAAHVTAELAAAGPLRVRSERADQPRELP